MKNYRMMTDNRYATAQVHLSLSGIESVTSMGPKKNRFLQTMTAATGKAAAVRNSVLYYLYVKETLYAPFRGLCERFIADLIG